MKEETITRIKAIITLVVMFIASLLDLYGVKIDADATIQAVLVIFNAVTIVWGWWYNQNMTSEAQAAQTFLKQLKSEKKAENNAS